MVSAERGTTLMGLLGCFSAIKDNPRHPRVEGISVMIKEVTSDGFKEIKNIKGPSIHLLDLLYHVG